jgi:hypothetical protein
MNNLDILLAKPAQEWNDDDILQLIEGLREQRSRWNQEQAAGTRTRVPAAKVALKEPKKDLAFEGLKL